MSAPAPNPVPLPAPVSTTTIHGDVAVLSYGPLDPAAIEASVRSSKAGAVVSFVGYTRDEFQGKTVTHLEYESFPPLALKTLHTLLLEARLLPSPSVPLSHCIDHTHSARPSSSSSSIEITHMTIHHLLGLSPPLTPSLVICVSSAHRKEAFVVCEWLLERVKERVQVWKREWYGDGTGFVGRDGEGVEGRGGRAGEGRWKENFPERVKVVERVGAEGEGREMEKEKRESGI